MDDFVIPIDGALEGFYEHMKANPRTILSSKFGDGKSYFLKEFKDAEFVKKDYVFLTIYPVNYQVASNEDIFSLIKRDVIYQLLWNEMISDDVAISNDIILWFFLQNKGVSLLADLLSNLSTVAIPNEYKPMVVAGLKSISLFKVIKDKFNKYKSEIDESELLDKFLDEVDSHTVYEEDIITAIIKKAIEEYKQKTNKKVVLVVEDLDRIDPAHLFRILNIFSAHIDYCYKYGHKAEVSIAGNKFGLDNIVLVCDFSNIRKLFRHFYGGSTDFKGYIGKFLSSAPYTYSLYEERNKYIYEKLALVTECPLPVLKKIIREDYFDDKTIREIVHVLDLESRLQYQPFVYFEGRKVLLCPTMLRVLSVLRRLGFSDDDMKGLIEHIFKEDIDSFYRYIVPFLLLSQNEIKELNVDVYIAADDNNRPRVQQVYVDEKTGKGSPSMWQTYGSVRKKGNDFQLLVNNMLRYVSK